jgi:hypothetical protein
MKGLLSLASIMFLATIKMLWPVLLFLFVLLAGLATGCAQGEEPASDELLLDDPAGDLSPADEQYPPAVEAGLETLSRDLAVTKAEVEVLSYYQTEWQDGCLGLGEAGEFCTQEIVSGWYIFVQVGDHEEYEVRTNEDGRNVRWYRLQ